MLDTLFGTFTDTGKFIPQGGARVQPSHLRALLRATSSSRSSPRHHRLRSTQDAGPVRSGWPGAVGAFGMDIAKLIPRGEARAQPPLRLALLRVGRLGSFDPSVGDVCRPGGTFPCSPYGTSR